MSITNIQAKASLTGRGESTEPGIAGTNNLGRNKTYSPSLTTPMIYTVKAILWGTADDVTLDVSEGTLTTTTAETRGTQQVETATAAGTVTTAGNVSVTITAAGMANSPKEVLVPVQVDDTASEWAEKVRTALSADTDVTFLFTVGGSTTAITLTRDESANGFRYANDATLNIDLDANGTGITTAATSAVSASGVASTGTQLVTHPGVDFDNTDINLDTVHSVLIERADTGQNYDIQATTQNDQITLFGSNGFALLSRPESLDITIECDAHGEAEADVEATAIVLITVVGEPV